MLYTLTDTPAYATALTVAVAISLWNWWRQWLKTHALRKIDWRILRVAAAIALNFGIGLLYARQTGNSTPWQFNMFIDSGAALAILYHPAGREQAFIGWLYGLQISAHLVYGLLGLLGVFIKPDAYYTALTIVAYFQLFVLGDWGIGSRVEGFLHNLWPRVHAVYSRARIRVAG